MSDPIATQDRRIDRIALAVAAMFAAFAIVVVGLLHVGLSAPRPAPADSAPACRDGHCDCRRPVPAPKKGDATGAVGVAGDAR